MALVNGQAAEKQLENDDEVFYPINKQEESSESPQDDVSNNANGISDDAKVNTIDRYGFIIGLQQNSKAAIVEKTAKGVATKRERKWLDMTSNWDLWMSKHFKKVRKRCRKGIPDAVRARAWVYLSCANKLQDDNHNMFAVYLKQPIGQRQETEITNDLHRTFPNHNMFADDDGLGQKHLYNVLRAYTAYNPKVGYCQAHAPIVSVLLMHLPEEEAFWCLIAMLEQYLPNYYGDQLEEVKNDGTILLNLLRIVHPKMHKRLKDAEIDSVMFMVEWFMCLFSRDLPWPSVLRIWDIFFCEGVKILFRVALVLLKYCTAHLDKIPKEEYELLPCLKTKNMPPAILQADFLIAEAYNLPIEEQDMVREHRKLAKKRAKEKL